ncbi:MAG: hypothetical protein WA476_08130 [Acidobacteriaceae bacterium]
MMLWKSWRDLRVFVFVGFAWLALLSAGVLSHPHLVQTSPQSYDSTDVIAALMRVFLDLQTFAFAFLAWGMGTRGIGRDIGNGSGSFVLTRPARHAAFVWTEWGAGLAAIALLLAVADLLYWGAVRLQLIRILDLRLGPDPGYRRIWVDVALPFHISAIATLCAFLFVALIFSLTHLGTIVLRHSTRGLLFCIGCLIGYLILGWEIYLHHPSWSPYYPDLLFQPFYDFPQNMNLVPDAAASIFERLALLPLFPLIAQLTLLRAEV